MPPAAARYVRVEALLVSPAPVTELGVAAYQAQQAAGLERADFIVVAVEPGRAGDVVVDLEQVAQRPAPAAS